jgi:DNA-directed RNA polymerase specialized sigma24 family protein
MAGRLRKEKLTNPAQRSIAWESRERLREETLVYFVREFSRYGDTETSWYLIETLIERVAAHIQRKLSRWRLTPEDADDCVRDLYATLCEALLDTSPTAEFWEVRFWVCLDRRLYNIIEKRQLTADAELSPGDQEITEDEEKDADRLIAQLVDTGAKPDELAEWSEARSLLSENEWMALYLVYLIGLPEESEDSGKQTASKVMGVTGRSIRNYLKRAKQKLIAWHLGARD